MSHPERHLVLIAIAWRYIDQPNKSAVMISSHYTAVDSQDDLHVALAEAVEKLGEGVEVVNQVAHVLSGDEIDRVMSGELEE